MKRCLIMLLLMGLLLTAGCMPLPDVDPPPYEDPNSSVDPTQQSSEPANDPDPVQPQPMSAEDLRSRMNQQSKPFAVAYLGFMIYGEGDLWSFLERDGISMTQALPVLKDVPEENLVCPYGCGEVFCILPADPQATVRVYGCNPVENEPVTYDALIFEGTGENPIILACNVAYSPDMLVEIEFPDETMYRWFPRLDPYGFVEGLWGGEMSSSEDGFETLDASPYNEILLAYHQYLLNDPGICWTVPAEEDLVGKSWYDEGYDADGEYYLYRLEIQPEGAHIRWVSYGEEHVYPDAKWSFANKDGVAVLTIDFREFAGLKSYNLLLDSDGFLYAAVDATGDRVVNEWERQYRFLRPEANNRLPDEMVGSWERIYTEVEGYREETPPGVCTAKITGSESDGLQITYTDQQFPSYSYSNKQLSIIPGENMWYSGNCRWAALVDYSGNDMTRYVSLQEDDTLLVANSWTIDGMMMVSIECFRRVG